MTHIRELNLNHSPYLQALQCPIAKAVILDQAGIMCATGNVMVRWTKARLYP